MAFTFKMLIPSFLVSSDDSHLCFLWSLFSVVHMTITNRRMTTLHFKKSDYNTEDMWHTKYRKQLEISL